MVSELCPVRYNFTHTPSFIINAVFAFFSSKNFCTFFPKPFFPLSHPFLVFLVSWWCSLLPIFSLEKNRKMELFRITADDYTTLLYCRSRQLSPKQKIVKITFLSVSQCGKLQRVQLFRLWKWEEGEKLNKMTQKCQNWKKRKRENLRWQCSVAQEQYNKRDKKSLLLLLKDYLRPV